MLAPFCVHPAKKNKRSAIVIEAPLPAASPQRGEKAVLKSLKIEFDFMFFLNFDSSVSYQ